MCVELIMDEGPAGFVAVQCGVANARYSVSTVADGGGVWNLTSASSAAALPRPAQSAEFG